MSQAASFASLEPKLLANKGAARPAMRVGKGDHLHAIAEAQSALGWNDTGNDLGTNSAMEITKAGATKTTREGAPARAAFTLRLDPNRHFKLRLASTLQNCSAQLLVTEALDQFLKDIPQLDSLAEQASAAANKS